MTDITKGRFKELTIYAITQDGQGMRIMLTESEKVVITETIELLHGGVIKAYKDDEIVLNTEENYDN